MNSCFLLKFNACMKFVKYIFLMHLALAVLSAAGQDAQFSQFYANPVYIAPSFAGSTNGSRVALNYRDQWPNVPGHFVSYSFSFDHFIPRFNSGVGILALRDMAGGGKLAATSIGAVYSYRIRTGQKTYFQPGISAYYYNRSINFSKLSFADQYFGNQYLGSSVEIPPGNDVMHVDFASSMLMYNEHFWTGFNIDHLMKLSKPIDSDYQYPPMRFSLFGGVRFIAKRYYKARDNETVTLAVNYRNQASIHQLDVGAYYYKSPFIVGVWYRGIPVLNEYSGADAIILMVGYKSDKFSFGYSYDFTVGRLITATGGAHEISVVYLFNQNSHPRFKKRLGAIPCPEF